MSRVLVIGDVHGCAKELAEVLHSADIKRVDQVVFAGDLLDKGPDPIGVVVMARQLADETDVVLIEGNHEYDHRKWREKMHRGRRRQAAGMLRADEAFDAVVRLCQADIDFLDRAVLYKKLTKHKVLVTHAGVPPKMKKLPSSSLKQVEKLPAKKRQQALDMENIRYVTPSGGVVPKGKERKRDKFWAEVYDGRFGTVMFGHQPFKFDVQPVGFPFAVALDLGCATGNRLGAALLTPGAPPEYIVAPATFNANAGAPIVLPDPGGSEWLGYARHGDRWIPVSESASPAEAYEEAAVA